MKCDICGSKIEVTFDAKYFIALTTERLEIYDLEKAKKVREIKQPLGFTYAASFGFQVWSQNKVDWFTMSTGLPLTELCISVIPRRKNP